MPSRLNSQFAAPAKKSGVRLPGAMNPLESLAARPASTWPATTIGPATVTPNSRPKVLVADEDALCLQVLVRVLGVEYAITTACNSEEVLAKLRAEAPQLVVLSATLPGASEPETCRVLYGDLNRGAEGRPAPLVLMLGTNSSYDERADALERGASDYLEKPFGMREFAARVRVLLRPRPQLQ